MSIFTLDKPRLTVETQDFIDDLDSQNNPPLYTLPPEAARKTLLDAQSGLVNKPEVDMRDFDVPFGSHGPVPARLIKPKGARDRIPCVFYLHGGGWVMGNRATHDRLVREIAVQAGVAVLFPEYVNAPEAQYPAQLEQSYAVLEYARNNVRELGLDPDGFVIAGDSAGGTMATVLAMMARERGGPNIIFQLLFYPVVDHDFDTDSYRKFADGPWLTKKAMKYFWDNYIPEDRRDERNASPLQARDEDLEMLPPTLIITAENDVLRDEGEEYAKRLDEVGVPVACVRMMGTIHDFVILDALRSTAPARTALALAVTEIKRAFQATFPESRYDEE